MAAARPRAAVGAFDALAPSPCAHPAGGDLGYRRCRLRAPNGTSWVATNGLAARPSPGRDEVREDAAGAVADAILATAPDGVLPPGVKSGARRSSPRA